MESPFIKIRARKIGCFISHVFKIYFKPVAFNSHSAVFCNIFIIYIRVILTKIAFLPCKGSREAAVSISACRSKVIIKIYIPILDFNSDAVSSDRQSAVFHEFNASCYSNITVCKDSSGLHNKNYDYDWYEE